MDVILLERVDKLGQMGEVVTVKPGYARNYLLPKKKAMRATKENMSYFETLRTQLEADNLERRGEAESVSTAIDGLSVILTRQASDNYQLYGSVRTSDIAAVVAEAGFTITRNQVELERSIKTVGLHQVRIRLHPEVAVTITVNVARTQEEAKAQARGETLGMEDEDEETWRDARTMFDADAEPADADPGGEDTGGEDTGGEDTGGEDRA